MANNAAEAIRPETAATATVGAGVAKETARSSKAAESLAVSNDATMQQMKATATKITTRRRNRLKSQRLRPNSIWLTLAILMITVCFEACAPEQTTFTDFRRLPANGWKRGEPLHFAPQYADSSSLHSIALAVRHDNEFPYKNLGLTIDLISSSAQVERVRMDIQLADSAGNWRGGGFGALYQIESVVRHDVDASKVAKVVVWQGMETDTLRHIVDVGIIVK